MSLGVTDHGLTGNVTVFTACSAEPAQLCEERTGRLLWRFDGVEETFLPQHININLGLIAGAIGRVSTPL